MVWNEIVSAVCIYLSSTIFTVSLFFKSKTKLLALQLLSSVFYISNFAFVISILPSALVGTITAVCEIIRIVVFYVIANNEKLNTHKNNLIAGIAFSVVLSVCVAFSWCGAISLLPLLGSILVSMALGSKNLYLLKGAILLQTAMITTYLFLLGLALNAIAQLIVFAIGTTSLVVMLVKDKIKK